MIADWLENRMFAGRGKKAAKATAKKTAHFFNDAGQHKSHGRRIGRDEARTNDVTVEDLEIDQDLQDAVLTAYHLMTIMFENTPSVKTILTSHGNSWIKNG